MTADKILPLVAGAGAGVLCLVRFRLNFDRIGRNTIHIQHRKNNHRSIFNAKVHTYVHQNNRA